MRRTERRGYRTAKAVELLVKVRRRTQNPVRRRAPKRALSNGKQTKRRAGCSWGRVPQSQGKMEGGKGTSWDAREIFSVAKIARSSDCCVPRVVCGFRFCGTHISGSLFFKGHFECCESC